MVDLITRLQVCAKFDPDQAEAIEVIQTQAARIVELEAALRNIEADCDADYPPSYGAIKYAARAALGEKE